MHIRLISFITSAAMLFSSSPFYFVGNAAEKGTAVYPTEVKANVIIRIQYLVEGGGKVFNDYSVSLVAGDDYSADVPSPTFSGYEPYILKDGEYVSAEKVHLSYDNLQSDQEITVIYRAAKSPYTVRYFLQNISNDNYTENGSMTFRGEALTGEYPQEEAEKKIEGFTPLFHEPDTVAADGSTEFLVYYDRNYYQYSFDCNGGYGTDSIYARYGTNLVVPNPTKHGYVFVGWDREENGIYDGIVDNLPSSIQAKNEVYKAIWEPVETTVRVVYWLEDPDEPGKYNYLTERPAIKRISGTEINIDRIEGKLPGSVAVHTLPNNFEGADKARFYEYDHDATAEGIAQMPLVEGDGSTVVSIYYKRKEYTLKFYYARSKVEDGETKYYVVGGSTYGFSTLKTDDDRTLFNNIENYDGVNNVNWGEVAELPPYDKTAYNYTPGQDKFTDDNGVEYTYYYISFTAKYGQNIENEWPFGSTEKPVMQHVQIAETEKRSSGWQGKWAVFSGWNPEYYVKYCRDEAATSNPNYTIKGDYIRLDESLLYDVNKFPDIEDSSEILFLAFWENGANVSWNIPKLFVYNLYIEVLNGAVEQPGQTFVEREYDYDGDGKTETKRFYLYKTYRTCDDSSVEKQTATPLLGFTYRFREWQTCEVKQIYYKEGYSIDFFYTRNSYRLRRTRYDNSVYAEDSVQRGAPIKDYLAAPSYPDTLEPDAYVFDGWYRSPVKIEHVNEEAVMPSADMSIYAKWVPKKHSVTFSKTIEDMQNGNYISINGDNHVTVDHNTEIYSQDIPDVTWEGYEFKGWFYLDSKGAICAFDPHTMPVTEDLNLFGQWKSPIIAKYTVHYVSDGKQIADDTEGHTFVGNTKTFTAKAEKDLYTDFKLGYFPKVNSKSMVIKPSDNVMTIEYKYIGSVDYTVKYVDSSTGKELLPSTTKSTEHSVITEQFKFIENYVADAFYKKLVLTTDSSQNVVTFYYVKTEDGKKKINYAVKHFTEELDGTYSEYSEEDLIANQGDDITAKPLSITGFVYNKDKTQLENSGMTVSDSGVSWTLSEPIVVNIYYQRKEANVRIHFVEYGNQKNVLQDPIDLYAPYGKTESYTAVESITKDKIQYTIVGSRTRSITFREGLDGATHIYIYYQSKNILVNYQAVCRYPGMTGGTVSPMSEIVTSGINAAGSVPLADEHCDFVGWYEDEACTTPVNSDWVNAGNRLVPKAADSTIYYALFEPVTATLKITKSGVEGSDQNQSFLFEVKGNSSVDLTVSITGNGSVTITDLPRGEYTVTEITEWSWRYDAEGDKSKPITLTGDSGEVTFENKRNDKKWLGGESQKDNRFEKLSV